MCGTATDDRRAMVAANLRRLWNEKKGPLRLKQTALAAMWGVHPSAVSQWINGHTALGVEACMRFSEALQVRPDDIDPWFPYPQYGRTIPGSGGDTPDEARRILRNLEQMVNAGEITQQQLQGIASLLGISDD